MTNTRTDDANRPAGDIAPPSGNDDERTTLVGFLDYLRDAVARKALGAPDAEARAAGAPSGTSLLGLVKHLTGVELNWFVWGYAGEGDPADHNAPVTADESAETLVAAYRAAAARANEVIAKSPDLDTPGIRSVRPGMAPASLRWILVHMIEETARHAGHADILREQIDGTTGR
ncbi:DinB family protein [Streptomyces sp. A7024]|uniref:DinB family protein n=1 Tax=Streptomyces coryli TaxID=1128680 RepID=A0A6G4UB11_9ACTN|nr:DinB family protein [Streptomyces coryli]NGN68381.1 DinB family protein [Streptomyces coryli]